MTKDKHVYSDPDYAREPMPKEVKDAIDTDDLVANHRAAERRKSAMQLEQERIQAVKDTVSDFIGDVRQFMLACGQARQVADHCSLPPQNVRELRRKLIDSEHNEFHINWQDNNIAGIADDLADMIYVIVGTALAYGIPLDKVWRVVQEANMSKLWTQGEVDRSFCGSLGGTLPQLKANGDHWIASNGWKVMRCLQVPGRYVVLDADGKVRKPPSWQDPAPKVKEIIDVASRVPEQEANRQRWNEALTKEAATASGRPGCCTPHLCETCGPDCGGREAQRQVGY